MIIDVAGRDGLPAALAGVQAVKTAEVQVPLPPVQVKQADSPMESSPVDRVAVEQTVAKLRESISQLNSSLRIEIDPDTDRVVVKVLDDQSGEVIRQIPSQEMVEIAKRLDAMQGIFLTKRT